MICGAWSKNDVFSFRHALLDIAAQRDETGPTNVSCPIEFTEEEVELHNNEWNLVEGVGVVQHQLQNGDLIPLGGYGSERSLPAGLKYYCCG
jgi:hypothetical protein